MISKLLYTTFKSFQTVRRFAEFEDYGWLTMGKVTKHNEMLSTAMSSLKSLFFCNLSMQKYGLVFTTSSRLFTRFLGLIAKRNETALFLDIRDLFSDTLKDLLNIKIRVVLPIINYLEKNINGCC